MHAAGFTVRSARAADRFNQSVEMWEGGEKVAGRISADRGQWWLEVGRTGTRDLFDPDMRAACLDAHPNGIDVSTLAEQAAFVRDRASEVAQALSSDPGLPGRLRRTRETRARVRLGLPPAVG